MITEIDPRDLFDPPGKTNNSENWNWRKAATWADTLIYFKGLTFMKLYCQTSIQLLTVTTFRRWTRIFVSKFCGKKGLNSDVANLIFFTVALEFTVFQCSSFNLKSIIKNKIKNVSNFGTVFLSFLVHSTVTQKFSTLLLINVGTRQIQKTL